MLFSDGEIQGRKVHQSTDPNRKFFQGHRGLRHAERFASTNSAPLRVAKPGTRAAYASTRNRGERNRKDARRFQEEMSAMVKMSARGVAMVAVLLLGGCAHQAVAVKTGDDLNQPFRIGREDVLDIAVWRDADLSRVIPVRPDGFISMPLAGEMKAEGKTAVELAALIKQKLTPYVQDPKVTVMVKEVNSTRFFVTGEVNHPGTFPLRGKVSVLQAIAQAGGFSTFANSDGIVVIRSEGKETKIPVRYSDLISGHEDNGRRGDVSLLPGDTVVVP
jgi:polysaccharide biosynthesis/export protein